MHDVNVIYGMLGGGSVSVKSAGYRYSTVKNAVLDDSLYHILHNNPAELAIKIDFIIRLLQSDARWPSIYKELDPNNTYDVPVIPPETTINTNIWAELVNWAGAANSVDKTNTVINKLLHILGYKE